MHTLYILYIYSVSCRQHFGDKLQNTDLEQLSFGPLSGGLAKYFVCGGICVFDSVIDFIEKLSDGVSILLVNWIMEF